ncbi:hypothetical protein KW782_02665 [Candidatus Parcubacteria bacterium]|nr:hypothetical protein [Candidatus Parcubacteria bacterium]
METEPVFEPETHTKVRLHMQQDLAADYLGIKNIDYKHPPEQLAQWFPKYAGQFGSITHEDIKNNPESNFLTRYEHATSAEERQTVLEEIKEKLYKSEEAIN